MTVLSWAEAVEDVGRKHYGDDWVNELTHRELWLIDNYDLPTDLHYPTFDARQVVPSSMRDELERALDRQAWMLDQHSAVADFLKSKGYEEGNPVDNPHLEELGHAAKAKTLRTPPEQKRTKAILDELFSDGIPAALGPSDVLKRINDHIGKDGRPVTKDTLNRVLKSM
jgi:hypothetical protein